jgi:septal ring factor EnvC (AmiA/AmiB activator)
MRGGEVIADGKPNPFLAKANNSPERMAELRETKAEKKVRDERARIEALPQEIKDTEKRIEEIRREYEESAENARRLFKKVDSYDSAKSKQGKKHTDEYRTLLHEWDRAELKTINKMSQYMGMLNMLRVKRHDLLNSTV